MTVSTGFLAVLVTVAVVATAITPIVLLYLWFKEYRKGQLW